MNINYSYLLCIVDCKHKRGILADTKNIHIGTLTIWMPVPFEYCSWSDSGETMPHTNSGITLNSPGVVRVGLRLTSGFAGYQFLVD